MKRVLSLVLATVMVLSMFAGLQISSSALETTGQCGENVYYTFDESTGTLTISGSGETYDYDDVSIFFYYDEYIKSVIIENGVTHIGNALFFACGSLKSVTIPNSVASIGKSAFSACRSLTSVTIPASVTSIDAYTFKDCNSLTSVTIPASVTSIGDYTFEGCSSLTSITIPDSVTSIGDSAFAYCSGLTSVTIPNSVISIGKAAFEGCCALTSIDIPDFVESIEWATFRNCSSLTSITIPNGVTGISEAVFYGCSSLASITIPNSVKNIIGNEAFYGCSSLTSITIPEGVTIIDWDAFRNCSSLTSVTIPNSVTRIYEYAFCDCEKLKDVYYKGTREQWNSIDFVEGNECLTSATIHYNEVSHVHDYKAVVTAPKANAVGYTRYKCSCGEWKKDAKGNVLKDKFTAPTGKPAGLKCTARTAAAMKFTWNKTTGANGYQVQLLNSAGKSAGNKVLTGNAYSFTKLAAGHAYKARVRFYIKAADGKNYYGAWATISSPTLPAATSITKVTGAKKAFTAQWKKGAVTGYQLQYATNAKFSGAKVKAVKGVSKVSLKVGSLKGGTKYFVRVRTFKAIGGKNYYSTWSATKAVTTKK